MNYDEAYPEYLFDEIDKKPLDVGPYSISTSYLKCIGVVVNVVVFWLL